MKTNVLKLVKWFCRKITFNELASAVVILHEVLNDSRKDIDLKPEPKPAAYRQFRVDRTPPLTKPPEPPAPALIWQELQAQHKLKTGKTIPVVRRREGALAPPRNCICQKCGAPARYLYLNDGQKASQVRCKICGSLSPTHRVRIASNAKYWCPHCGYALAKWKEDSLQTIFKCPNYKCPNYLDKLNSLSKEAHAMREAGNTSQFKLHYQYREYHFSPSDLACARPEFASSIDLRRIRNNYNVVSLVLTFSVNLGLSSRQTREALRGIFGISISHQTVINYANACAALLSPFVDKYSPKPDIGKTAAADETYIIVNGDWHYTWFIINKSDRAICGWNLSNNRGTQPALALLYNTYGLPEENSGLTFDLSTDGAPAYDTAVMAYNRECKETTLFKHTVIGLENLDEESKEYRSFKQLIERLNRTYKFHTRPRSGFKEFDGAVCLTVLFVAFYNFMRPHSARNKKPPVKLECLDGMELYPQMWTELLKQAAA